MTSSKADFLLFFISLAFQLEQSRQDDKSVFEYVNVQWNLSTDDASTDFSDEDQLDDKVTYIRD